MTDVTAIDLDARTYSVHEYQGRVLASNKRVVIFPAGRRAGKSEVAALWCLLHAGRAAFAGQTGVVWCVFPVYRLARIGWRKVLALAPSGWVTGTIGTESSPDSINILGRVTLEFRSTEQPERLVGEGVLALWLDECGAIPERAWMESLRPTLIDHAAPALLTGSPKGSGWFRDMYLRGWNQQEFPEYESVGLSTSQGIPSFANPWIPREEVDDLAREMPERVYQQEILARFISSEGEVFKVDRVVANGLRYSKKRTVALGVDLARTTDFTVLTGMDADFNVTYWERFREVDWPLQRAKIANVVRQLDYPMVVIDATGVGDPVSQELMREGIKLEAFVFTPKTKLPLIERLIIGFDSAALTLPDEPILLAELLQFSYKVTNGGYVKYGAPDKKHDDCVMSLALAFYGANRYADSGITLGGPREEAVA
jgi:hypothetical protein